MKIQIQLFAYLRKYAPGEHDRFELEHGATLGDIASLLGIPTSQDRLNLVNGRHADDETRLAENDEVSLLTPMEGG